MEGHRLARTVAYGDLSNDNPAPITHAYEQQADAVFELQLEKVGVKLACLLDPNLIAYAARQKSEFELRTLGGPWNLR
jgi:hypothetical protein